MIPPLAHDDNLREPRITERGVVDTNWLENCDPLKDTVNLPSCILFSPFHVGVFPASDRNQWLPCKEASWGLYKGFSL